MSPRSLLDNLVGVVHSGHSRQLVGGAVEPDIRNSVRAVKGGQHGKRAKTLIERICVAHEAPSKCVFLAAAGYKSASDIVHAFVRRPRSSARPSLCSTMVSTFTKLAFVLALAQAGELDIVYAFRHMLIIANSGGRDDGAESVSSYAHTASGRAHRPQRHRPRVSNAVLDDGDRVQCTSSPPTLLRHNLIFRNRTA